MKKAQVSIEIIIMIGIIVVIFISTIIFSFEKRKELLNTEDYLNKRNECLKISGLVAEVYASGDGTIVNTKTDYLITIYNRTYIGIKNIENVTEIKTEIAVLASEAGETTQSFYDIVTEKLNPDWYKICFSDISGSGCQKWQSEGMEVATWDSITKTLNDLIKEVNNYDVIYLEDPTMQYNAEYDGKTYLTILEDWVKDGNIIILSEHVMCRERSSGSYSSTSYRCNPPGYNSDVWDIFGQRIFQRGGNYGNPLTVIIEPDEIIFPNLNKDDKFDFEEDSFINQIQEGFFEVIATYDDNSQPAILRWDYGEGKVFYFGDFQVEISKQDSFSNVIAELIEKVEALLITTDPSEILCFPKTSINSVGEFTNNIRIKNSNNDIIIENV